MCGMPTGNIQNKDNCIALIVITLKTVVSYFYLSDFLEQQQTVLDQIFGVGT